MNELLTPIITAVLGFLGGLVTPWIRWLVEAKRNRDSSRRRMISDWRAAIDTADFYDERNQSTFGSSAIYSSLRAHMRPSVISKFEEPRTMYVGGGRGEDVRKQMLFDEVARLEKGWKLL